MKSKVVKEYVKSILIALVLALFIRTFVVQAYKIPSGSMIPTLMIGDHILVNKFIYGVKLPYLRKTIIPVSRPKRGDVIVFIFPLDKSKDFIKRVIGLPGDKIEIIGKKVYINGHLYPDKHAYYDNSGIQIQRFGPIKVPKWGLFVMGDNRNHSYDSRFWGFVPLSYVKGKAFFIYWSWPHWRRSLHVIR